MTTTNKILFQLDGHVEFNGVIPAAATVELLKTWRMIEQTYLKGGKPLIVPDGNYATPATAARPAKPGRPATKRRH
jgi:hypothetical protein